MNNNKIAYKKELNFFSFQNLYTIYNKNYKNNLIGKFFVVLNKENWLYLSKFNRNQFFNKIKFLYEFKIFINFYKIKGVNKNFKLYSLRTINKNLKFFNKIFKNYYKFGLRKYISILTLKNIFLKYIVLKNSKNNLNSKNKTNYSFYSQKISGNKYSLEKKFNYLKKKVNKKKVNKKLVFSLTYNLFIKKFLYFIKSVLNVDNWIKYKQIVFCFVKMYSQDLFFNFEYRYFNKIILFIMFNKIYPIIKKKSTKEWNTIKIFKTYLKKFNKKRNLSKFKSFFIDSKNLKLKLLNNKNIFYKNKYSLYKNSLYLHPFSNILKFEYKLYLKKNPYKFNTLNYFNYLKFNNFIKWKRKKIITNLNWKIFDTYYSYNKKDFYKDLFVRYKNIYTTKFIYKNNKLNLLFNLLDNRSKIFNNTKYYLGWYVFKTPLKLKDWFYQKDFFCFPTWFYNYEKITHLNLKKKNNNVVLNKLNEDKNRIEKDKKIKENKNLLLKKSKKIKILKFILSNKLYKNFKYNKKFLYLLLKYKKLLPLKYKIRREIKKILLNYAYIVWSKTYSIEFERNLLHNIIVYLFKHYSFLFKKRLLDKIRFNKNIRNWQIKLGLLNKFEGLFDQALNNASKKYLILNILKNKRYDSRLKKNYIQLKLDNWNDYNKDKILDLSVQFNNYISEQDDLINKKIIKNKEKIKKEDKHKNKSIILINNYKLFQKKYNQKLLNAYNIGSSLNNLFYKYYNVPKLENYKAYNNYFKQFKLIISDKLDKKKLKVKKTSYKKYRGIKLLFHKNFINTFNINLYKFYIMYGFKWFN